MQSWDTMAWVGPFQHDKTNTDFKRKKNQTQIILCIYEFGWTIGAYAHQKNWVASRLVFCTSKVKALHITILFFMQIIFCFIMNKTRHTEPMCSKAVKPTWLLDSLGREMVTFTWKYLHCSKVRICE